MAELKLPSIALAEQAPRAAFIAAATRIVDSPTIEDHDPSDTWVNILHAVDRAWGLGGRAWTGAELTAAASARRDLCRQQGAVERSAPEAKSRRWPTARSPIASLP
jgi:hypothetical protein